MTGWSSLTLERSIAASPLWILVRDAFTGAPPRGPLSVSIERAAGSAWLPIAQRHRIGANGDLAFVGLGRTRDPQTVGAFTVRVTVSSPGTIAEWPGGDAALVTSVASWAPSAPVVPASPTELLLYPGPAYAFPAGTPLLAGRVLDAAGDPVARARVQADETVQSTSLTEEVRSDADGRFRLALRWSAGATTVQASRAGTSGSIQVVLPSALSTTHQITLT